MAALALLFWSPTHLHWSQPSLTFAHWFGSCLQSLWFLTWTVDTDSAYCTILGCLSGIWAVLVPSVCDHSKSVQWISQAGLKENALRSTGVRAVNGELTESLLKAIHPLRYQISGSFYRGILCEDCGEVSHRLWWNLLLSFEPRSRHFSHRLWDWRCQEHGLTTVIVKHATACSPVHADVIVRMPCSVCCVCLYILCFHATGV